MDRLRQLRTLARNARPAYRQLHYSHRFLAPDPIAIPTTTTNKSEPTLKQRLKSPLPITEKCPPSTCPCVPSPSGLDIDRETPLAGVIPPYYRHILISTGKSDWASKIEFDGDGGLAQKIKQVSSAHSLRDPFSPTLITNSSIIPKIPNPQEDPIGTDAPVDSSAYIFPSNIYIPQIPKTTEGITKLIREYLIPPTPFTPFTPEKKPESVPFPGMRRVAETVVLICSHTSRDTRCGALAGPLKEQFENVLKKREMLLRANDEHIGLFRGKVRVAFTSHLSGHKFAGNVIVYIPPEITKGHMEGRMGNFFDASELGLGVWYGRVEPKHVEGIVDETVIGRRVIGELCRGVVGADGN